MRHSHALSRNAPVTTGPFLLARVEAHVLRWPVKQPVQTSFGVMHDRPAVLVRIAAVDGNIGCGEIWCNFPACGAEHWARLLQTVIELLFVHQIFGSAEAAFAHMSASTAALAIQSGGPGPTAQVIAGVNIAIWDLLARRAQLPLWTLLGGTSDEAQVYASGTNPYRPLDMVLAKQAEDYRAFKLKSDTSPAWARIRTSPSCESSAWPCRELKCVSVATMRRFQSPQVHRHGAKRSIGAPPA